MSSFTRKKIDLVFKLSNNKVFDDGSKTNNTLSLTGLRVIADIKKVGMFGQGTRALIRVFGMKQSDMNILSTLNWQSLSVQRNTIIVSAGDDVTGMSEVFGGQIKNAWADYQAAPDVCLVIEAMPGYFDQINPANPTSYPAEVDVATAMKDLAAKMNYAFVDNGVSAKGLKIPSSYLAGTLLQQARTVARHANILMMLDHETLTISPIGSPMPGEIPVITPSTGLIGYPAFHQKGISFTTLYNPAIKFNGKVKLADNDINIVNGEWIVVGVNYQLESEKPNGAWFNNIEATGLQNAIGQ